MTDLQKGWLAGIIDGEGCITIYKGSAKGHLSVRTDIRVESTDLPMITLCALLMGEAVGRHPTIGKPLMRPSSTRPAWRVQIHRKVELLQFLEFITPTLVTKRREAELVMQYLRRSCVEKYYKPTAEDILLIDQVKDRKRDSGGGSRKGRA